jgi:hypothetical protein
MPDAKDLERFMETIKKLEASSQPGEYVPITKEISAIFKRKPQTKQENPRSFPMPCAIAEVNIEGALYDLDSNINLTTLSLADGLVTTIVK